MPTSPKRLNKCNFGLLVGESKSFCTVLDQIEAVAATPCTVLIMGETGTGKELVARAISDHLRQKKPFVRLNCAALPSGLVESDYLGTSGEPLPVRFNGITAGLNWRMKGRFSSMKSEKCRCRFRRSCCGCWRTN